MRERNRSQNPEIVIIAAVAANRAIGKGNALVCKIPEDLVRFRQLTEGGAVVMGRKTWESLPSQVRPLPNRRNIVISRQSDFVANGATVVCSLNAALESLNEYQQIFIIGGEQIYKAAMPLANRLEITEVDVTPEADTWFPEIDISKWKEESREYGGVYNNSHFYFVTYSSKRE